MFAKLVFQFRQTVPRSWTILDLTWGSRTTEYLTFKFPGVFTSMLTHANLNCTQFMSFNFWFGSVTLYQNSDHLFSNSPSVMTHQIMCMYLTSLSYCRICRSESPPLVCDIMLMLMIMLAMQSHQEWFVAKQAYGLCLYFTGVCAKLTMCVLVTSA